MDYMRKKSGWPQNESSIKSDRGQHSQFLQCLRKTFALNCKLDAPLLDFQSLTKCELYNNYTNLIKFVVEDSPAPHLVLKQCFMVLKQCFSITRWQKILQIGHDILRWRLNTLVILLMRQLDRHWGEKVWSTVGPRNQRNTNENSWEIYLKILQDLKNALLEYENYRVSCYIFRFTRVWPDFRLKQFLRINFATTLRSKGTWSNISPKVQMSKVVQNV